jgi:hypothetical protein
MISPLLALMAVLILELRRYRETAGPVILI